MGAGEEEVGGNQSGVFAASATASVTELSAKLENKHASTQPIFHKLNGQIKVRHHNKSMNPTAHKK